MRRLLAGLLFACASAPAWVSAQQGGGQGELQLPQPPKDDDATAAVRPYAPDLRSGGFLLRVRGGVASPVGRLASGLYFDHLVTGGPSVDGSLGVGIARYASLELGGGWAWFPKATGDFNDGVSPCISPNCEGGTAWAGLSFVYHPVQALAFDPTLSFGMGWRAVWLQGSTDVLSKHTLDGRLFHAIEPAKVSLGGEFYPVPQFGFGPVVSLDLGVFVDGPEAFTLGSVYTMLSAGIRLSLEPTRKAIKPSGPAKAAAAR